MKIIKTSLKYILTLPQSILHLIKGGVNVPYKEMVTFFRYFPLGRINRDHTVDIRYRSHPVKFYYGDYHPYIVGELGGKDYDSLPVEGYEVLDIGASVGDTAIMFALRGAKRIVGYELNKRRFDIAQKNIQLNKLDDKVIIHLCGISSKKFYSTNEIVRTAVPAAEERLLVDETNFKTLDMAAAEGNFSNVVLKMDVEGFEYDILRSSSKRTLNRFSHITMEYHYGTQDIVSIFDAAGFESKVIPVNNVIVDHHPEAYKKMEIGMIHARRVRMLD